MCSRVPLHLGLFLLLERSFRMLACRARHSLTVAAGAAVLTMLSGGVLYAADYVNAQLPWHGRVLDAQGRLLAWYEPDKNLGYDQVMRLGWDFIEHKVPNDMRHKTGLKIYLINSVFNDDTLQGSNWQHNPAMVYGSFVDSVAAWYPYSGVEDAVRAVREMLDYELAQGTTPAKRVLPVAPFVISCCDE